MWADTERNEMDTTERVHGYTGASGLIQAFAGGYFLWDLVITVQNVRIFGIGMLFHAISALCVFSLGFVSLDHLSCLISKEPCEMKTREVLTIPQTAPIRKLLCPNLHPLRALLPLPQHPLVL